MIPYLLFAVIILIVVFYEIKINNLRKEYSSSLDELVEKSKSFKEEFDKMKKELINKTTEEPTTNLKEEVIFWKNKYERSRYNNGKLNSKVIQLNNKLKEYEGNS